MRDAVSAYLAGLTLGTPQNHENLSVIPLLAARETPLEYITLDQALRDKLVEIKEVNEGGSVQNLKVINHSPSKVLILDGEELVGAKQNRISNASFVIPAESEKVIPVSCIEEGRWRYNSRSFSSTDSMYAALGRRAKLQDTTSVLRVRRREGAGKGSDVQSGVWSTVKKYLGVSGTSSTTDSFVDYHEQRRSDLDSYVSAFESQSNQVGILVRINDQLQGMDTFGKHRTWQAVFPKLIRSYAMDAIVRSSVEPISGQASRMEPDAFLGEVSAAPRESFDSIGEGEDLRLETDKVIGAALVLDETLLHLTAFPKSDPPAGAGPAAG